jgi:DNA-directed RNA polymerase alpha subunit
MLGLSVRTFHCLERAGIVNLGQLCQLTPDDVRMLQGSNDTALEELRRIVAATGLRLRGE